MERVPGCRGSGAEGMRGRGCVSRGQQAAGEEPVEEVLPDLEGFGNSQIARRELKDLPLPFHSRED